MSTWAPCDLTTAHKCLDEALELAGGDALEVALLDSVRADVVLEASDTARARSLIAAAVPVLREHDQTYRLIECLDTCAALAALEARLTDAALLVGAADRALEEDGSTLVPADAAWRERRIGSALADLDPAARAGSAAQGARLDLDAALDVAMEMLATPAPLVE